MRIQPSYVAMVFITFVNCSTPLHIYPIKGPLVDQQPIPVITAKLTGWTSGIISFQLPTGETCKGPWAPVPQKIVDNQLSSVWDSIYGSKYYASKVMGSKYHGKAIITGNMGINIQLEFIRDTINDSPLHGVARDNEGNVYKITQ